MHLTRFPRRRYTPHATPIEKLDRLTRHLGGPDIYIKRDDLTGLAPRARRAEFHKQVDGVYPVRGTAPVRARRR